MEINPLINRLTEFKATIISLNNPSLISRLIPSFELESVNLSLSIQICKWGALFLALAYAFTNLAYKLQFLILHFRRKSKSLFATVSDPLLFDEFSTDDDVSSSSGEDNDEEEEQPTPASSYGDLTRFDDDFRVKGGCRRKLRLRRRRSFVSDNLSLSEFVSGNGVVKLWESAIPAVLVSPSVIFTANAGLGLWDLRMKMESPAVQADWWSDRRGRAVGIDEGRTGKVYVSDDVSMGLTVGDVRKVDTPLEYLTEFGGKLTALF